MRTIEPVWNTLRRLTRPIRRRGDRKPSAVILGYHSVVELAPDVHGLSVSPSNFERHIEYIRESCHPTSLLEFVDCLHGGSFPDRSVIVTFDDGYVDNLRWALPLLEAAGVPATVFVSTGYTRGVQGFWWDELQRMLLVEPGASKTLELCIDGGEYRWPLRSASECRCAHDDIHRLLAPLGDEERDVVLERLADQMKRDREPSDDHRPMTAAELRRLSESDLIDIGAHTVTHPRLSRLSPQDQRDEISAAREALEAITGKAVRAHAHPYGDFNEHTVQIVRELGFAAACTTIPSRIQAGADVVRLPRFKMENVGRGPFGRCLEDYFFGELPL